MPQRDICRLGQYMYRRRSLRQAKVRRRFFLSPGRQQVVLAPDDLGRKILAHNPRAVTRTIVGPRISRLGFPLFLHRFMDSRYRPASDALSSGDES
jgi:hypothetical protein